MNVVIQYLTYSDILTLSGWGLISPIVAVFFTDQINGGSVEVAGFAMTIFFLTKSLAQIPAAKFIDARPGERDDYIFMVAGSAMVTICAFLYMFASEIWHVYAIQILYGIGCALSYPAWMAIFTRHIDKKHEGLEWSVYYTSVDIASALTAALGGLIALQFGYESLFLVVGVMSFLGCLMLSGTVAYLYKK